MRTEKNLRREVRQQLSSDDGSLRESVLGDDDGDERGAARTKKITAAPMDMRREETNELTTFAEGGGPADDQREVRQQEGKRRGDG